MISGQIAHYRIVGPLGRGGTAEVYRARDQRLGRDVALKILPGTLASREQEVARLDREARTVASLNHPNIVTVYSFEEFEGLHFYTMELVEGHTLEQVLESGPLETRRLRLILQQLADALREAHHHGIVHRDLKPANLMLSRDDRVRILDFGLALGSPVNIDLLRKQDAEATVRIDEEKALAGTVPYMAPEILEGKAADARSDMFSLGVTLFELAAGYRPFEGSTPVATMAAILEKAPPRIDRDLDADLERAIEGCLQRNPASRPTAAELVELLAEPGTHMATSPRRGGGPSIAVLPFVDMSPQHDQEHFCDGIAEELINRLARIQDLRVPARTSAFRYRDTDVDIRKVGRDLDVRTILEGSVRKSGDQLRITAQLIDVESGYHLWSESYDRYLADIFAIQDEISEKIVDSLQIQLRPEEESRLHLRLTRDVEAYDYFLRGRRFYYQYRRKGVELALQMYSRAIECDPLFVRAHAGMADCHCFLFLYAEKTQECMEQADASSRRAMELDPGSAEAHVSRGQFLSLAERHEEAESHFEVAQRLDPRLFEAYYLYARDRFAQGEFERAAELFEGASRVSPGDYQALFLLAQVYESLGRNTEAQRVRRQGVGIAERRLHQHPGDVRALYMAANAMVALGEVHRGLEWAALAQTIDPMEPMVLYNVGCIYSLAGEYEKAISTLEKAAAAGLSQKGWYLHDSNLDPLRGDPRFQALLDRL